MLSGSTRSHNVFIPLLEDGGHWYRWQQMNLEGWLCLTLFKYFSEIPQKIYCQAESLR
ncbi:MAG: hypothetical protein F6J96_09770 [Symploca sp. SIO1C2]|nr:hypothetical protein [Symploca sp. SIO1C2]